MILKHERSIKSGFVLTGMLVLVIRVCMFISVGNDMTNCSDNCSNNFYAIPVPSN